MIISVKAIVLYHNKTFEGANNGQFSFMKVSFCFNLNQKQV